MKKKLLSLVLALALVLSVAPAARADFYLEYPHIAIGENDVYTFEPKDNPDLSKDYNGQGWSWNAASYTLTLNNVNQPSLSLSIEDPDKSVTIVVNGANTLYSLTEFRSISSVDATSTLTGSGTLNLTNWGVVDVVDGPTVTSAGSFNVKTLKSGLVSEKSQLASDISIKGGRLIVDAVESIKNYGYKDKNMKPLNSAVSAWLGNVSEEFLQGCILKDENGQAVTVKKQTITSSSGSTSDYMVAVKADGSPAEYVEIYAPGSAVPAQPEDPTTPAFTDVPADAYYADPVAWAVAEGITNGTSSTTFSPNETCTRAQIITFLWRAADSPEPQNISAFSDVKTDSYYAKAAAWAKENGMASGDTFSPDASCSREMAVEFMWKHAGSPNAAAASFSDVSSPAVNWAVEQGVTDGTSKTTFSPNETCTRGQIVTFLYRGFAE